MRENELDNIIRIISSIKIPEEHKDNVFWAPRVISKSPKRYPGFTLYAYGGAAISLYHRSDNTDYGSPFDDKYCKHFTDENEGNRIKNDFMKKMRESGIAFLETWEQWNKICEAMKRRSEGEGENSKNKVYVERKRENRIANNNSDYDGKKEVFDMEACTRINEIVAKADLMWINSEGEHPVISFVEYKCTNGAMVGSDYSLPGHFKKMVEYYNKPEVMKSVEILLNQKRMLNGQSSVNLDNAGSEIVFLFSHVNNGLNEGYIKNRLWDMYSENKNEFEKNKKNVILAVIKDENESLESMKMIRGDKIDFSSKEKMWAGVKKTLLKEK